MYKQDAVSNSRKFRYDCENFAILEKLGNFARLAKFRYLGKFTVLREIHHFSLSLIFFARLEKFR